MVMDWIYLSKRSTQPRSSTAALFSSSHLAKGKGASTRRLVSGTHGGLRGMSDGIGFPAMNNFVKVAKLIVVLGPEILLPVGCVKLGN